MSISVYFDQYTVHTLYYLEQLPRKLYKLILWKTINKRIRIPESYTFNPHEDKTRLNRGMTLEEANRNKQ